MTEPSDKAAPQMDVDPTATSSTETHDAEQKKDKPRDSKGWDGKLRLNKKVLVDGPHDPSADSDAEAESEDEGPRLDEGPPPEQLAADEDLLDDFPEDEDEIDLVHLRISSIPALRLERFAKLRVQYASLPWRVR
jgi:protein phosphatase 1 regulatory subunit 7